MRLPCRPALTGGSFQRGLSAFFGRTTAGAFTGLFIVPIADFRVIAGRPSAFLDVVRPVGITSVVWAVIAALLLVGVTWIALLRFARTRGVPGGKDPLLTIISTAEGRASLSTLQIIMWSFVVGASAVYVMVLSGNLIAITTGTLVLLAVSGVVTVGNKMAPPPASVANAPPPPPPGVQRKPLWSDLVFNDDQPQISPARVQMLFFTVIIALFVSLRVLTSGKIPEIPEGYLGLMGISNGVYLAAKFVRP